MGQQLVHMVHMGADQQGAITVLSLLLVRQQRTPQKVVRNFRSNTQQHFCGVFSEPYILFAIDVFRVFTLGANCCVLSSCNAWISEMLKFFSRPSSSAARYQTPF